MLIHTNENPFTCNDCGKKFNQKSNLKMHKLIHAREKKFGCKTYKNRNTYYPSNLYTHSLMHTGTLKCEICGKNIESILKLKKHIGTHSKTKRFQCDICKSNFTENFNLRKHMLIHSEKQFACDTCGKKFSSKYYLKAHEAIHGNRTLFSCSICSKSYATRCNLNRHVRKMHKGESSVIDKTSSLR